MAQPAVGTAVSIAVHPPPPPPSPDDPVLAALAATAAVTWADDAEDRCLAALKELAGPGGKVPLPVAVDTAGHCALHLTIRRGWDRLAAALIEAGMPVDLEAAGSAGQQPVHWAVVWGSVHALHLLVEAGCRLDRRDANGCAPLLFAAQHGARAQPQTPLGRALVGADSSARLLLRLQLLLGAFQGGGYTSTT